MKLVSTKKPILARVEPCETLLLITPVEWGILHLMMIPVRPNEMGMSECMVRMQQCFSYQRCLLSASNAVFRALFMKITHNLPAVIFSTFVCFDKILVKRCKEAVDAMMEEIMASTGPVLPSQPITALPFDHVSHQLYVMDLNARSNSQMSCQIVNHSNLAQLIKHCPIKREFHLYRLTRLE